MCAPLPLPRLCPLLKLPDPLDHMHLKHFGQTSDPFSREFDAIPNAVLALVTGRTMSPSSVIQSETSYKSCAKTHRNIASFPSLAVESKLLTSVCLSITANKI